MLKSYLKKLFILMASATLFASQQAWSAQDIFFDETFVEYQQDLEGGKDDGKKRIFIFYNM